MTPKREAFCLAYIETGNASEAYRQCYNAGNMNPETIKKRASELLAKGDVKGTVKKLQAEHRKRHNVTVDTLTDDLEDDRQLAHSEGQAGAAVSATMGKAKIHGLIKDRHEYTGKDGGPIEYTAIERRIVRSKNTDG